MNTCVHELKDGSCEVWGTCPETIDCEDYVTYKDKKRAKRRHNDVKKAIRKRKITREVYGEKNYYDNLHQYSKNKIHCSCPLCSGKTSPKKNGHYYGLTGSTKSYHSSDAKKMEEMEEQEKEYMNGEYDD